MRFKSLIKVILLCLLTTTPLCAFADNAQVTLQLKWKHAFQFAGVYMALEKGYFKDEGLDVKVIEGAVGIDVVEYVLNNDHAYAIAGSGALLDFAHGKPIQTLGAIFQHSPHALLVKQDSGITRFADLKGKRIMLQPGFQDIDNFAALKRAGVHEGDFIRQTLSLNLQDLISNKTDAFSSYTTDQPHQLKLLGIPYRIIHPNDERVDFYGDILITSADQIHRHPAQAESMMKATALGWVYALENINEAIDLILEQYNTQQLSKQHLAFEAKASAQLIMHNVVNVGYMNASRWRHIAHIYAEQGLLSKGVKIENFMYQPQPNIVDYIQEYWLELLSVALVLLTLLAASVIMVLRKAIALKTHKLSESATKYRQMVEASPEPIAIHSAGRWVYVNPAGLRLFGMASADSFLNRPVLDFVHPDDHSLVMSRMGGSFVDGQVQPLLEERLLKPDGSTLWAEVTALSLMFNEAPASMVLIRDLSSQREASALMTAQNHRMAVLRDILTQLNMTQGIDEAQQIAVQGAIQVLGCDSAALLTIGEDEKLHFSAWQGLSDAYRETFDACSPWSEGNESAEPICIECFSDETTQIPTWIVKANQQEGIAAVIMFPLVSNHNLRGNLMVYYHQPQQFSEQDVSFGKILVNDLVSTLHRIDIIHEKETMLRQVEHSQRLESLGVLAGGVAHDFNNILTAIMSNAAIAERKFGNDDETAKTCLNRIVQASERAALLCQQMLDYSGKGQFIIKPVDLSALVISTMSLLESSVHRGVSIKSDFQQQLPWIEADEAQLQQVVMNVIINASESIEGKNGTVSLATGVMDADQVFGDAEGELVEHQYVYLEVKDTGTGMSEEVKGKLFEPFFTTKFSGRGLGMSAVLGIMRGHGGTIAVGSVLGEGTTFQLLFPILDKVDDDIKIESLPVHTKTSHTSSTILIIDDEESIRLSTSMMLEDMGFSTLTAVDGLDGIDVYRQHQQDISLVLLDMTMPKLDGKGCFKALRDINADVEVVITSGYAEQKAMKHFSTLRVADFIQKPYSPEKLESTIHHVLLNIKN